MLYNGGAHMFQNYSSHLKIVGERRVTRSSAHMFQNYRSHLKILGERRVK
jgi:hypothetical protein